MAGDLPNLMARSGSSSPATANLLSRRTEVRPSSIICYGFASAAVAGHLPCPIPPALSRFVVADISCFARTSVVGILIVAGSLVLPGCLTARRGRVELPAADSFEREQLRIFSDIHLPRRHRLLDELTARRRDIASQLLLPMSDEPINVYVFDDEQRFTDYMGQNHPNFPQRRAFFVKNDTDLRVFAYWGEQVGDDLRHEVTHGYLHSVVSGIPLWLDEGLAEYFELPRGSNGFHQAHIAGLVQAAKADGWVPDLERLESLSDPADMTQLDYAEAWLWVHYLLETGSDHRKLIQDQLARIRMTGDADPLSTKLGSMDGDATGKLVEHLEQLASRAADPQ